MKKAAFTAVLNRGKVIRSLRTDRWTYIETPAGAELYDAQNDPRERADLARDAKRAGGLEECRRLLQEGWKSALPPTKSTQ